MGNGLAEKQFEPKVAKNSPQFSSEGIPHDQGIGLAGFGLRIQSVVDELPAWWSPKRDRFLRATVHDNSFIAAVVYGESARVKNAQFSLVDETKNSPELVNKFNDMFANCNFGSGFPNFCSKVAMDLLTQDNGAFIELIGSNGNTEMPLRGEVKSFAYMDPAQCWRTFDPMFPVIYVNPYTGIQHIYHHSRIIVMSQFEQGQELARGVGLCALARAYEAYRLLRAMNVYLYEKVTGQAPEIHLTNLPGKQFDNALREAMLKTDSKAFRNFKDHAFISPKSVVPGMPDFKIQTVGIKSTPTGFDHKDETELAVFAISAAFGVDPREYWATVQTGATKSDAEVQNEKSQVKGLSDIINMIENSINWRILPPEITLRFNKKDSQSENTAAMTSKLRAETRRVQIEAGEISIAEARFMAAEMGDIEPSLVENEPDPSLIPDEEPSSQQAETEDKHVRYKHNIKRSRVRKRIRTGSSPKTQTIFKGN